MMMQEPATIIAYNDFDTIYSSVFAALLSCLSTKPQWQTDKSKAIVYHFFFRQGGGFATYSW